MKIITIFILAVLSIGQGIAQTDKNGNPVFNSVSTSEKSIDDMLLISNYYTLRNNIENRQSSVFISENPTLHQIEKASVSLDSDFFILTKESRMVAMVVLQNEPKRAFTIITMSDGHRSTFPCKLKGDITENRAREIIREKYDASASMEGSRLMFNGKEFVIISNQQIEDAVQALIKKEKLDRKKPSDIILPSKDELKHYILSETKEGGELDFFTAIKGKEYDGVQIKQGVFTTRQSIALYKWGRACFDMGVNTVEDALAIFAEHQEKPVNDRDQEYIKMGFNKEWEK